MIKSEFVDRLVYQILRVLNDYRKKNNTKRLVLSFLLLSTEFNPVMSKNLIVDNN